MDISFLEDEKTYHRAYELIPHYRQKKADSYRFPADRQRCVASALLLNVMLQDAMCRDERRQNMMHSGMSCEMLNIIDGKSSLAGYDKEYDYEVGIKENGKPYLLDYPEIYYNLSHTASAVVCVVADSEAGIDAERIRPGIEDVADRFYSENEKRWIKAAALKEEKLERATRLWTLKESYSKLTGRGIALELKNAVFDVSDNVPCMSGCEITEYKYDGYYISVIKNL